MRNLRAVNLHCNRKIPPPPSRPICLCLASASRIALVFFHERLTVRLREWCAELLLITFVCRTAENITSTIKRYRQFIKMKGLFYENIKPYIDKTAQDYSP